MLSQPRPPVYCLLVDDREPNLVALEALLQRDDLILLKAYSGVQALELLLKYDVALAMIDVQMPEMDGFELAELMRGTEKTRRVPIMFLTAGQTDQQRRFRGYEAGAVDFLQKPIEPDILKSKADVFFELYRQRQEVAWQRDELAAMIEQNKRLLEESHQYSQALQAADRKKDEFLATLAHELRNPMAPILSSVQLLKLLGDSNSENNEIYDIIERQVKHMVRLVDDLLEVSRITSGKFQMQLKSMNLVDAVRNAIETSQPLLEQGNHQFEYDLPATPLHISGDLVRMTQALANLLNNAAKYTPEGGHISLKVDTHNNFARIQIRDTGLGIPAEMQDKVFEMFTQVDQHLKRSLGGMGIGLALVKQIVASHGGEISVSSKGENQGAEFTVLLPLDPTLNNLNLLAPNNTERNKSYRILIADDNPDALRTLQCLLKTCGHEVVTAEDGYQAIEHAKEFHPQIILLDLGMPGMGGLEAAQEIRKIDFPKQPLLVALTGWGQEEDRRKTREAGFDLHLVKPINVTSFQKQLTEYGL